MRIAAASDPGVLFDPATYLDGVPHAEFARLRREAPVSWVEEKPLLRRSGARCSAVRGSGYWAVTRHATIVEVSRLREVFSSGLRGAFLSDPKSTQELEQARQMLVNMDLPDHARIRRSVTTAFKPKVVASMRASILARARELVEKVRRRNEFDAVRELTSELPLLAIADLVGMPIEDRDLLFEWSTNLVGFDDPDFGAARIDAYKRTFVEANAYARELVRLKRRRRGDDLISGLVHDALDRGMISEDELCSLFLLVVVAGNETSRHLLSGSLQTLVQWPDQRDRIVASPQLIPAAVEELLRYVSPVVQFRRTAVVDTELDGQAIRAGEKVVLYYVSGNYDEDVFHQPTRLKLSRMPNPHLAFGVGPHFCLGAALARLEATALLEAMLGHLDRFELTGPVERLASNFVNGIKVMPARIHG